jgi:hypothetical protein
VQARLARPPATRRLRASGLATLALPLFAYGAAVNGLPYLVPRWLARRFARKETDYATIRLLASMVAFPVFWAIETWVVWRLAGAGWALAFAVSLPVSGLIAYHYWAGLARLRSRLRFAALTTTHRQAASRLLTERQAIIEELEQARADYVKATRGTLG